MSTVKKQLHMSYIIKIPICTNKIRICVSNFFKIITILFFFIYFTKN